MSTALITGASSGLGEQFAYSLGRRKYNLVLIARREERMRSIAARAKEMGAPETRVIACDLSRREAPEEIQRRLDGEQVTIDYLVNNAGFGTSGHFERLPLERELEEIDLNVKALVALTRLFLPAMVRRHGGTILNVASTAAFQPVPYMTTYAATKAFVLSFSQGLAAELSGTGVTVTAVCPGPVRTEFQGVAHNEKAFMPSFTYMEAPKVVEQAIAAAASRRGVYVNGALNFTMAQMTRFVPRSWVTAIARNIYRPAAGD
ncbi:MAG: SDR family NAD(P)-dependent oxidoreductase [Candidatus Binataceae bacterium]